METKVSVLVTFYNQEQYVDQCLKSIFMQSTDFDFKVIIGDDGSEDGTLDKIREWQKDYPGRISYIVQDRNPEVKYVGGFRASRNRLALLKEVDTPYFIFLDGDDYWTSPDKLAVQVGILEDKANSDCVAAAHQMNMFYEKSEGKKKAKNSVKRNVHIPSDKVDEGKYSLKYYWNDLYFHTDSILFRSEYIKEVPYDLMKDVFNDNLITFFFLQFGKVYYLPVNMADYRQNDTGIWAGDKHITGVIRNFMAMDTEMKLCPSLRHQIERRHIYDLVIADYKKGEAQDVNPKIVEAIMASDMPISRRVIGGRYIFSENFIIENLILFYIGIRRLMYRLNRGGLS